MEDVFSNSEGCDISEVDEGINPNTLPHGKYNQVEHIGFT